MLIASVLVFGLLATIVARAMITDTLTITWASGSDSYTQAQTYTQDTRLYGDYPILPGTVDQEITIAFTAASLAVLAFFADGVMTIKTNSTTVPGDTITTVANQPVLIRTGQWPTTTFAATVTKIFVSNATAGTLTLRVRGLKDGTV